MDAPSCIEERAEPTDQEMRRERPPFVTRWWRSRAGRSLIAEFVLLAVLLQLYRSIRLFTKDDLRDAFSNARDVVNFERALGLPFEDNLQRFVLEHPDLVAAINHYYVYAHFPVAIALVLWLYCRHHDVYRWTRSLMVVVTFSALVIHLVYPLAPPRMMPGFVDTLMRYGPQVYDRSAVQGAANQIAAMPSLHFGWALIASLAAIKAWRSRWRWLTLIHPVLMALAIMATANHWWMDAAVAGLIIGLSWAIMRAWPAMLRNLRGGPTPVPASTVATVEPSAGSARA